MDDERVEFAHSLPPQHKLDGGIGKLILRVAFASRLPEELFQRRKQGIAVPMARWLAEDLLPTARELLSPERLKAQGIFNADVVTRLLDPHAAKRANHRKKLWTLLVFQLWHDRWMTPATT